MDLGQMVMFEGQALITRSSSRIFFFKQVKDKEKGTTSWQLYDQLKHRGFIYFIKGNIRIQVTCDTTIYFYLIDRTSLRPIKENAMFNQICCDQMMFGRRVRYCITYKTNERSFDVFTRKNEHNLKVCIDNEKREGAKLLNFAESGIFLATAVNKAVIYDSSTY